VTNLGVMPSTHAEMVANLSERGQALCAALPSLESGFHTFIQLWAKGPIRSRAVLGKWATR
jgi:hypothetical protein